MNIFPKNAWWSAGIGLAAVLFAPSGWAQSSAPFAYWQNDPGVVLRPLGGPIPDWQYTVGMGAALLPVYEGSIHHRVEPAPNIDIRYSDIAFASVGEGLGVNLLRGATYRAGVALTYDIGREHSDAARLRGTGTIRPAPEPKIFAEAAFLPVIFSADLRERVMGATGMIGDLGAYMPVVANETLQIFVGPAVTFADGPYMNTYFGITPQHAQPYSIFKPYHANGGFKNVNFGATALYHFNDHWFVNADVGVEKLLGSAAASPIVQTSYQFGGTVGLNYTWN